jgi:hypothetical protein
MWNPLRGKIFQLGPVAELADALALGASSLTGVKVRVLSGPPSTRQIWHILAHFLGYDRAQFASAYFAAE